MARQQRLTGACDYNYRSTLSKLGRKACEDLSGSVAHLDDGTANEKDCQHSLGISVATFESQHDIEVGGLNPTKNWELCDGVLRVFPNPEYQVIALCESHGANCNGWSAWATEATVS
jgi:2-dehydro-3-deoxygluconokinase